MATSYGGLPPYIGAIPTDLLFKQTWTPSDLMRISAGPPVKSVNFGTVSPISPTTALGLKLGKQYAQQQDQQHSFAHDVVHGLGSIGSDIWHPVSNALHQLGRTGSAVAGAAQAGVNDPNTSLSHTPALLWEMLKGGAHGAKTDNQSFGKVLASQHILDNHHLTRGLLGFGLDVVGDPLTYVGGAGIIDKIPKVTEGAVEAEKAVKAYDAGQTALQGLDHSATSATDWAKQADKQNQLHDVITQGGDPFKERASLAKMQSDFASKKAEGLFANPAEENAAWKKIQIQAARAGENGEIAQNHAKVMSIGFNKPWLMTPKGESRYVKILGGTNAAGTASRFAPKVPDALAIAKGEGALGKVAPVKWLVGKTNPFIRGEANLGHDLSQANHIEYAGQEAARRLGNAGLGEHLKMANELFGQKNSIGKLWTHYANAKHDEFLQKALHVYEQPGMVTGEKIGARGINDAALKEGLANQFKDPNQAALAHEFITQAWHPYAEHLAESGMAHGSLDAVLADGRGYVPHFVKPPKSDGFMPAEQSIAGKASFNKQRQSQETLHELAQRAAKGDKRLEGLVTNPINGAYVYAHKAAENEAQHLLAHSILNAHGVASHIVDSGELLKRAGTHDAIQAELKKLQEELAARNMPGEYQQIAHQAADTLSQRLGSLETKHAGELDKLVNGKLRDQVLNRLGKASKDLHASYQKAVAEAEKTLNETKAASRKAAEDAAKKDPLVQKTARALRNWNSPKSKARQAAEQALADAKKEVRNAKSALANHERKLTTEGMAGQDVTKRQAQVEAARTRLENARQAATDAQAKIDAPQAAYDQAHSEALGKQLRGPHAQASKKANQAYRDTMAGLAEKLTSGNSEHLRAAAEAMTNVRNSEHLTAGEQAKLDSLLRRQATERDRAMGSVLGEQNKAGQALHQDFQNLEAKMASANARLKTLYGKGTPFKENTALPKDWVEAPPINGETPKDLHGHPYMVPPEVHSLLMRYNELAAPDVAHSILRAAQKMQQGWKFGATTLNPGFQLRNQTGEIWNMALDHMPVAAIPLYMGKAAKLMYRAAKGDPEALRIFKEAWAHGAVSSFIRSDVTNYASTGLSKAERDALYNAHKATYLPRIAGRAASKVSINRETASRIALYIWHRDHGLAPTEAAAHVRRALFDYDQLTPFERKWMRGVVAPFYTWARKNIPYQLMGFARAPGQMAYYTKAMRELNAPNNNLIPSYEKPFGVQIGKNILEPSIALSDLAQLERNPKGYLTGLLNPGVGLAAAAAFGINPNTGTPFNEGQNSRTPFNPQGIPASILSKIPGLDYGRTSRVAPNGKRIYGPGVSPQASYVLSQLPMLNQIFNSSAPIKRAITPQGKYNWLIKNVGGQKIYPVNNAQQLQLRQYGAQNYVKRTERDMRNNRQLAEPRKRRKSFSQYLMQQNLR